jgi:hypothetical protein
MAAGLAVLAFTVVRGRPVGDLRPQTLPGYAPGPTAQAPAPSPGPEPVVPQRLPDAEPALDRQLSADYRKALETLGLKITVLTITDRRKAGGARAADVVYQTQTRGDLTAVRPEIARIFGAGTSSRLALDIITVRAARADGRIVANVSAGIPDIERWLRKQATDEEFYRAWSVRTPVP